MSSLMNALTEKNKGPRSERVTGMSEAGRGIAAMALIGATLLVVVPLLVNFPLVTVGGALFVLIAVSVVRSVRRNRVEQAGSSGRAVRSDQG
ncbi:MAG: hypothetical protein QOC74_479 [Pseudonocardiales bacterium]|nr:hypothetical protein [Pseudonocardiales bacterium]